MNLRTLSIGLSATVLLGMAVCTGSTGSSGGIEHRLLFPLLFLPFYGFPPVISIMLSAWTKNSFSQCVLSAASLLYGVWFAYAVYGAFYVSLDPQSGLIFLFVGFAFLHVLFPLWLIAFFVELYHRVKNRKSQLSCPSCKSCRKNISTQYTMTLHTLSIGLPAAVLLGILGFLGHLDFYGFGTWKFLPFCGFPLIFSIMLAAWTQNSFSQLILSAASLLYGVGFAYAVYDAFYVNSDPQSALIFLFVGFAFFHVLFPLWLIAFFVEVYHRIKNRKARTEP